MNKIALITGVHYFDKTSLEYYTKSIHNYTFNHFLKIWPEDFVRSV